MIWLKYSCRGRECPRCFKKWAKKEGMIVRGRILDGMSEYHYRAHHVVISLDPKEYPLDSLTTRDQFREMRQWIYEKLRFAGAVGGAVVFHPWREDTETGEYSEPGMHFHCIVLAKWLKPGDEIFYAFDDNHIFKRIDSFKPTVLKTYRYILEHCGILENTHALTWFGIMAYNKMKKGIRELSARDYKHVEKCPHCGADLERMDWLYSMCKNSFGDEDYG